MIASELTLQASQLDALTALNARDLVTAFKLDRLHVVRGLIDALTRIPARRFSRQILAFDQLVAEHGLAVAGHSLLDLFARTFTMVGQEHVPATGPLLIVSNHPGMVDVMALWVGLACRTDLKIIAADRELLRLLPNTCQHLLFVPEHSGARTGLLRAAANHMRRGGALLTFPAGRIEPDPTVRPGAVESLNDWASSTALLARLAPEAQVLPAAVGGVISASALRNPVINLFRERKDRDWAAATLQVLIPAYRDTHTRVAFGPPVSATDLLSLGDPTAISQAIAGQVAPLLSQVME
jgi:1-acyl-sn-glycerol-3-phosphate acyltransferase